MSDDRPFFEVLTAAVNAEARRLTTAEAVRAIIGSPASADATLTTIIDGVSAQCVRACGLAKAPGATPATFGEEELRATWRQTDCFRGAELRLPWRAPITDITSVVEGGDTLTEGTDFEHAEPGVLRRLSSGIPVRWTSAEIVVEYTAGWVLPDADGLVPPDLVAEIIEQVKTVYLGRERDRALRQESTQDVGSASYSVAGGDSIEKDGLLPPLENALTPFRSWTVP